jgi:hypothetical protein
VKTIQILLLILITAVFIPSAKASDISKIKDREGNTKGYLTSDGTYTKIQDRQWKTTGYIDSEGNVYDREWNREGKIE